ncbi:unnamed protein product [Leptidea sinapis]|uniref:Nonsense-mediated mRNA decay factor SMG8 n=1 Tax=Leptidea sinapis TaxID=189913 RepID=A0A5E4Q992_9NEOP|nr:unnamed protein product [Leptidea sinapis]
MKVFSIHDIPDFSNKDHIVVVGIVGKSPHNYPNKTSPLISSVACEDLATNLDEQSKSSVPDADAAHWLVASGELAVDACKTMALLFHLCHIVILSSPTSVFDMGYLQLFKAIDAYRNELTGQTTTALLDAGLSGSWETHGRTCCPRLLFHFRRAPAPLRQNPAALKRLEHAVEDQIYFILRKARIITNVCAKSLFAIPKNEEFVYISAEENYGNARDMSSLVRGLVQLCSGIEPETTARQSFRQFLQTHLDLAFGEGFDDNVGKYAMSTSFFEDSAQLENEIDVGGALFDALATDVRFSQARCAKVLPIAQASYAEGLPSHYSSQHHAHKPCDRSSDGSKEHSSGVRYVSACDCGRSKCSRDDPYSVRAANCAFYSLAADEAASVKGSAEENQDQERCEGSVESAGSPARSGGWSPHDELSPGSEKEDTQELGEAIDVVPVSEEITSAKESTLSRQPSTTEYLPGMLHLDSPAHLLPAFPSWSLVQPVPGGPVFIPQSSEEGPIKLTASTYWILRLPYIYADERGPIQRPRTSPAPGSILPPIFGLQE